MANFRVWGRIEHIGPDEFLIVVTAVPENGDPSGVHTLTEIESSHDDAGTAMKVLLHRMGEIVFRHEGRVSQVEIQGG